MSVAAKCHKGFIEDICFLAQGRVDFALVFSSSFAAAVSNIGPNSRKQLNMYPSFSKEHV